MDIFQGQEPFRVLIIGDLESDRSNLDEILSEKECSRTFCKESDQAMALCGQESFDLILVNVLISATKGIEVIRKIQENKQDSATPVLVVVDPDGKEELDVLECGCDDTIRRPIDPKLLKQKIWKNLRKAQQVNDAESGRDIMSFVDGNPDYYSAIEAFVQNLPKRVEDIQAAFDSQALKELAVKLSASEQERISIDHRDTESFDRSAPEQEVDKIFKEMDSMIQLCLVTQFKTDCRQSDGES